MSSQNSAKKAGKEGGNLEISIPEAGRLDESKASSHLVSSLCVASIHDFFCVVMDLGHYLTVSVLKQLVPHRRIGRLVCFLTPPSGSSDVPSVYGCPGECHLEGLQNHLRWCASLQLP